MKRSLFAIYGREHSADEQKDAIVCDDWKNGEALLNYCGFTLQNGQNYLDAKAAKKKHQDDRTT